MNFNIDGGVGGLSMDLPDNAAVRVETSGGLGDAQVPSNYTHVGGDDKSWQSPSYDSASAAERITIHYSGGIGGLNIQ